MCPGKDHHNILFPHVPHISMEYSCSFKFDPLLIENNSLFCLLIDDLFTHISQRHKYR